MNSPVGTVGPNRLRRRARQSITAGEHHAAQSALELLLQQVPGDAGARMDLADVLLALGRMRDANWQLLKATEALPRNAPLVAELARRLYFNGEVLAARDCLDLLEAAPQPPGELLLQLAKLRRMLDEVPAAKRLLDRAFAAGIDTPEAYYLDAMLLQYLGRIEQAGSVLERCLKRWPNFGEAMLALARLRRQQPDANHVPFVREQLAALPESDTDLAQRYRRAEFESALFKELDDLGCYAQAWPSLERSNALMHTLNPYDRDTETAVTDAIIHADTELGRHHCKTGAQTDEPTPIFIVGMPRSGTTLLERMLSSHSQVSSAGELNAFLRQLHWVADVPPQGVPGVVQALGRVADIDFAELGARYLQQTRWRARDHRFYIDKLPFNFRMVGLIRRALPHAPIVHITRAPMDVCYSNLKAMFGHSSAYSYDFASLAHYYGEYARLAQHWRETLDEGMIEVSYEELVADPSLVLPGVLEFCGLAMEQACLHPDRNAAPVATPSSAQVRQPIHNRSIGEWQHYASQLEPLRQLLEWART